MSICGLCSLGKYCHELMTDFHALISDYSYKVDLSLVFFAFQLNFETDLPMLLNCLLFTIL